jgi:hypothetical protein
MLEEYIRTSIKWSCRSIRDVPDVYKEYFSLTDGEPSIVTQNRENGNSDDDGSDEEDDWSNEDDDGSDGNDEGQDSFDRLGFAMVRGGLL